MCVRRGILAADGRCGILAALGEARARARGPPRCAHGPCRAARASRASVWMARLDGRGGRRAPVAAPALRPAVGAGPPPPAQRRRMGPLCARFLELIGAETRSEPADGVTVAPMIGPTRRLRHSRASGSGPRDSSVPASKLSVHRVFRPQFGVPGCYRPHCTPGSRPPYIRDFELRDTGKPCGPGSSLHHLPQVPGFCRFATLGCWPEQAQISLLNRTAETEFRLPGVQRMSCSNLVDNGSI